MPRRFERLRTNCAAAGVRPATLNSTRIVSMNRRFLIAVCVAAMTASGVAQAQKSNMSFFLAANPGKGGDLGGLKGADARCQSLAKAAGAGGTWHAYLSTPASGGQAAVNARDRIGKGPWRNVKGVVVAKSVDDLHDNPNLNFET